MRGFSTLYGKALIVAAVVIVFSICLCMLKVQISIVALLLISPILIVLLGKIAELIILSLEKISTGPLSIISPKNTILLLFYYASFSIFLAFLIENSVILSLVNLTLEEAHVAVASLSLAFFPRLLNYASGMERARNTLLAILTPLTLTAAVALLVQPSAITLRSQTLQLCFVGSLIQPIIGDLTLYFLGFLGIIHPRITIETISLLDLKRLVNSQLETLQWETICEILTEAKRLNRSDIVEKILTSMNSFMDESRKRGAKLARMMFADSLTKTIYYNPNLKIDLIPFFLSLNKDKEIEIKARVARCYAEISRVLPEESLKCLSELLSDENMVVLTELGRSLTVMLQSNLEAVSHAIKLSLNPVFLEWLMNWVSARTIMDQPQSLLIEELDARTVRTRYHGVTYNLVHSLHSILEAVKAAYPVSPNIVVSHIQDCCSSKDPELKVLAAAILSDQEFAQIDANLLQIKKRLERNRTKCVRNALNFATTYRRVATTQKYRLLEETGIPGA